MVKTYRWLALGACAGRQAWDGQRMESSALVMSSVSQPIFSGLIAGGPLLPTGGWIRHADRSIFDHLYSIHHKVWEVTEPFGYQGQKGAMRYRPQRGVVLLFDYRGS